MMLFLLIIDFLCYFSASDATQIFEETKHSVEAREMMQAFFVGIFVEVSRRNFFFLTHKHLSSAHLSVVPPQF